MWRVWVDTGGTFTDCVGVAPDATRHRVKVLSSSALRLRVVEVAGGWVRVDLPPAVPARFLAGARLGPGSDNDRAAVRIRSTEAKGVLHLDGEIALAAGTTVEVRFDLEAPVLAAHLLTGTPPGAALPPLALRLATTRGTNALLERTGVPPAFLVSRGFADLLRIGDQRRPDLFALAIDKPAPLYGTVVEVEERMAADGSVVRPLDEVALAAAIESLRREGVRTAAVALVNSYCNPVHELAVAAALERAGFTHVSTSAALAPVIKLLPRAETAVVDAYLAPIVDRYLARVRAAVGAGSLHVMTSAGGLVSVDAYRPKDSLLSGPAGGVVGAAAAGRAAGFDHLVAFDMGGTSTDVSRIAGDLSYRYQHRVGDATVAAPALEIETVAAGGGSICWTDGDRLRVGPQSAGADPGPACYGAGGPLALTDVNLLLGRLDAGHFGIPIEPAAAGAAFAALRRDLEAAGGAAGSDEALLAGCLAIADERMAEAIRRISVRRGYDPADHALVAFGGAGGQHACAVAAHLGMRTVILPPAAGLLSAVGLGAAVLERFAVRQLLRPLAEVADQLAGWADSLADEACATLADEGVARQQIEVRQVIAELRLRGQEASLEVRLDAGRDPAADFAAHYQSVYGYPPPARPLEVVALRVLASQRPAASPAASAALAPTTPEPSGHHRAYLGGRWRQAATYELPRLRPGDRFNGPALVFDPHATLVVESGWSASVVSSGAVVLVNPAALACPGAAQSRPDSRRGAPPTARRR